MKIGILSITFPPEHLAGTEIAAYNIAKHLSRGGYEVHVITSRDEGLPCVARESGFTVHRISYPKIPVLGFRLFLWRCFLLLAKLKPEVVQVQGISPARCTWLFKKIFRRPYLVWAQGSDVYGSWRLKRLVSRLVLRNADIVIALTEDMRRIIQGMYARDVLVIPNGADLNRFKNLSRPKIRDGLGVARDEKIVLFVGRFHPVKGIRYLIRALGTLSQKRPDIRLVLVGDGEERSALEALATELNLQERISFTGQISYGQVPEYMAASDILVLPSLSEGLPLAIIEAMASGLPIVATWVGGISEIVQEGVNGFLVAPKNPEALAEKIVILMEDSDLRRRIAQNNINEVKKYSWEIITTKLEKLYKSIKR
jgi:glycosyltransferase involved in cell wall biosynthesis